eukprot:TRINITY_DN31964_c0_g1_i1.p1 TRINITY_DN31964_c0_g1~~TRINITY_DN31964_c0_g1_i1.p1  ORF type:complete len:231 (-),score=29.49 TRINITY_DN31964_c0_g1_i1:4-648(-)
MRTLQTLNCVEDPNNSARTLLQVELSRVCYKDEHLGAAIVAWIVLALFVVGYPITSFFFLLRVQRGKHLHDAKYIEKFGFLYRGIKEKAWWFRYITFIMNINVAVQTVFKLEVTYQILINIVLFLGNLAIVVLMWPYFNRYTNILFTAAGLARGAYLVVMVGLISRSVVFYVVLAVVVVSFIGALTRVLFFIMNRELPSPIVLWGRIRGRNNRI